MTDQELIEHWEVEAVRTSWFGELILANYVLWRCAQELKHHNVG